MKTLSTLFKNNIREYGMLVALVAVMLVHIFLSLLVYSFTTTISTAKCNE